MNTTTIFYSIDLAQRQPVNYLNDEMPLRKKFNRKINLEVQSHSLVNEIKRADNFDNHELEKRKSKGKKPKDPNAENAPTKKMNSNRNGKKGTTTTKPSTINPPDNNADAEN